MFNNEKQLLYKIICNTYYVITSKTQLITQKTSLWLINKNINNNILFLLEICISILGLNFISLKNYIIALLLLLLHKFFTLIMQNINYIKQIHDDFFINNVIHIIFLLYLFGFALANPENNALSTCFLTTVLSISNLLIINYSTSSCKLHLLKCPKIQKYFYFSIAHNYQIYLMLFVMCIFSNYFLQISLLFGLILFVKVLLIFSLVFYELEIETKR